jgi:hypothetical protein
MDSISIRTDVDKMAALMSNRMSASNFRFAVAKTLTNLAQEAQVKVRLGMPGTFHVRRNWVVSGIRIKTATKANLEAVVYSLDSGGRGSGDKNRTFMGRQETGGIKTPEKSREHIAIPLRGVFPNKSALIPNYMKPKALLGNPKVNKNGRVLKANLLSAMKPILVKGKVPGTEYILIKQNGKYVPAWLLKTSTKIKPTRFLSGPAEKLVKARAEAVLKANIIQAMKPR